MPLPSATPTSINELVTLLAQRLGIILPGDYWTAAELTYLIRNAIREFQCLTGYWRSRLSFTTAANVPFYDLHRLGVIPLTVTDNDILAQVGYALLEYADVSPFINTGQFSIGNVAAALGEQIDHILGETHLVLTDSEFPVGPPPPAGRFTLATSVLQIHRMDWMDAISKLWTLLNRTDDIQAYGFRNAWTQNPGLPEGYMESATPPLQVDLIPPPINEGAPSMLVTVSQCYTGLGVSPTIMNLPDDVTWALVWATLASVLRQDAQSRDYQRAEYCERRLNGALQLFRSLPCVLQAWPLGLQCEPSTLFGLDHWQHGWRNQTPGAPQVVAVGGRNILAVSPVSDKPYTIAIDAIGNSPGTGSASTNFSVTADIVTALLNNAQHTACFKLAGTEFLGTMGLYQQFLSVAQSYSLRRLAEVIDWEALKGVTMLENLERPYEVQHEEEEAVA